MSKVFASDLFKKSNGWLNFYDNFYNYKLLGETIDFFGRDINLNIPYMHHIHLGKSPAVLSGWKYIGNPYNKTTPLNKPHLDEWLIYAFDPVNDDFLLLTIAGPDAHNRKLWDSVFNSCYSDIVLPWINGKETYQEEP